MFVMEIKLFVIQLFLILCQRQNIIAQSKTQTTYTCEGDALKIVCPQGEHVDIMRATYGRSSLKFCSYGYDVTGWDLNCMAENSLSIVSSQCQNKLWCQVPASRAFFGEACLNTVKYLEIEYDCKRDLEKLNISNVVSLADIKGKYETTTNGDDSSTKYCPAVTRRQIDWPRTRPGDIVYRPCPNNQGKKAAWQCGWDPVSWIHRPDLSSCVSQTIINLEKLINEAHANSSSLLNVVNALASVTLEENELFGGDLSHFAVALKDTLDQIDVVVFDTLEQELNVTQEVNEAIVKSSSRLMSQKHNDTWLDLPEKTQAEVLNNLMTNIETGGFKLARSARHAEKTFHQIEPNIAVKILSLSSSNKVSDVVFPDEKAFKNNDSWLHEGDSMKLTGKSIGRDGNGTTHVVLALYRNLNQLLYKNCPNTTNRIHLNSKIISASIKKNGIDTKKLSDPIVFTLRHSSDINVNQVFCSFWDVKSEEDGWWLTSGCNVVSSNSTHTTCSCNHLTNFAILMSVVPHDLPDSSIHRISLTVITYFGCIVSIICLLLAFFTFLLIKSLNTDRDTIHRHLFITLCTSEAIFLHGISPYNNSVSCFIIAVVLHYFFLVAFMWMGLEGLQLYIMLVEVFDVERSRVLWYYLSAYGIPLIIVGTTVAVNYSGYETEKYCWLKNDGGFIWAFVGPVCVILMVNVIMLIIALRAMYLHCNNANWKFKQCGKIAKIRMWIKGAFVLVTLLGLTWLFGLLYFNDHSIFIAYLFTIFNSLQGFFIFVFHCLLYDKVIKEYRKAVHRISGFHTSFLNMFTANASKSLSNSTLNYKSNKQQSKNKFISFFTFKKSKSTSTVGQSSLLQSKNSPTAVDNSYHGTDSGYVEEHIYNEPTEDDPSFYLEPIKIKINLDSDMTIKKKGKIFTMDEDFSFIEGSVACTDYLDDNYNHVNKNTLISGPKVQTIDIQKYRIPLET